MAAQKLQSEVAETSALSFSADKPAPNEPPFFKPEPDQGVGVRTRFTPPGSEDGRHRCSMPGQLVPHQTSVATVAPRVARGSPASEKRPKKDENRPRPRKKGRNMRAKPAEVEIGRSLRKLMSQDLTNDYWKPTSRTPRSSVATALVQPQFHSGRMNGDLRSYRGFRVPGRKVSTQ